GRAFYRDDSGTVGDMSWEESFKLSELIVGDNGVSVSGADANAGLSPQHAQAAVTGKHAAPRKFDFVIGG
ncbi:MAG: hypothetical protein ACPHJ3_15565, partial [Rubripirellula sp.]